MKWNNTNGNIVNTSSIARKQLSGLGLSLERLGVRQTWGRIQTRCSSFTKTKDALNCLEELQACVEVSLTARICWTQMHVVVLLRMLVGYYVFLLFSWKLDIMCASCSLRNFPLVGIKFWVVQNVLVLF
ncbi:unnamed protein product [Ixodes persulcatus]